MKDTYSQIALVVIELQLALNQKSKYALKGNHRVKFTLSDCLEIFWKLRKELEKGGRL